MALSFPYREALVDELKSEIPAHYRKWDPDEKRWLILGAFAEHAITLLVRHFPNAETPHDQPRRIAATPARTETPATPRPVLIVESPAADPAPRDPLLAIVVCPRCQHRYEQPIRVVAEASRTVARRERTPPELIAVCPHCSTLVVVAFFPAVAGVAVAS